MVQHCFEFGRGFTTSLQAKISQGAKIARKYLRVGSKVEWPDEVQGAQRRLGLPALQLRCSQNHGRIGRVEESVRRILANQAIHDRLRLTALSVERHHQRHVRLFRL